MTDDINRLALLDLTGFQRDLLELISTLDEPKGLRIKEELEAWYEDSKAWLAANDQVGDDLSTDVNHGRLYPNLDKLVEKGLITKEERDLRTNEYSLTDAGRERLQATPHTGSPDASQPEAEATADD